MWTQPKFFTFFSQIEVKFNDCLTSRSLDTERYWDRLTEVAPPFYLRYSRFFWCFYLIVCLFVCVGLEFHEYFSSPHLIQDYYFMVVLNLFQDCLQETFCNKRWRVVSLSFTALRERVACLHLTDIFLCKVQESTFWFGCLPNIS